MKVHKFIHLWIFIMNACTGTSWSPGISCFKCTIAPPPDTRNKTIRICSKFEENAHFQVFCPKSTLCMKRTIHHRLANGTIVQTSVERGCAPQLDVFKTYDYTENIWRDKETIVEKGYDEGCFIGEDRGSPGGPPEYCFCSYHLCNGSETVIKEFFPLGIIIPSLIIIIRHLTVF